MRDAVRFALSSLLSSRLCASPAHAQDKYPSKPVQRHGAVRRRQRDRHHDPHRRRADAAADRPRLPGREQARRVRHPRDRGNGQGAARRLHAAGRQPRHQRADADHLQGQVQDRLRERSHDGDAARRDSADPRRHHLDFAPKTYAEFITYAKANPGKVRYASVGVGSNNHYDTEAFAQWAGIKLHAHPEQGRRRRHHQRRAARRCPCRAGQRRELGGLGAGRQAPGAGGDGGPAAAGISGCADAQGARLCDRQGAVVGALCARRRRRATCSRRCTADRAGARRRAGAGRVQEADDQGHSQCLDRGRARPGTRRRPRIGRSSPRR